jgi:predicted nucleotidyltransferase
MILGTGTESLLSEHQRQVVLRVLSEEEARREHVVVYLSGAHAYGFPSPDSDLDLKAIHIAATPDLLGFDIPPPTADRAESIDGVEIDYTSNELAHALSGVLAGNGNFIERVLGRTVALSSAWLTDLAPIVRGALSRRVYRHYRGFALNQLKVLENEPTAKKLLYVLRTSLTGIHLLSTGELEADLTRLVDRYGLPDAAAIIDRKRAGERALLDAPVLESWRSRIDALLEHLDGARAQSPLPDAPANESEVREWLLAARRARFT